MWGGKGITLEWSFFLARRERVGILNDEDLFTMAQREVDIDPVTELYKRDVDRTLISQNLRLSVQQRFEQLMELQRFAEELRLAGKRGKSID